jgi:hypothetical protein
MFKLPQLTSIDFPAIDFSRLDLNALRNSDVAKRLAALGLPAIDTGKVAAAVRDAAYLAVGLGVVGVERIQTRRRTIAATASVLEARLDTVVDRLESVLPDQAGLVVGQARDITRVARSQVRGLIHSAA